MKKEWTMPMIEELPISMTENGGFPDGGFDGPWEQLPDGTWWHPGQSRPV